MRPFKEILTKISDALFITETKIIGPDQYPLSPSDPYKEEHALINEYLEYNLRNDNWTPGSFLDCEAGKAIMAVNKEKIKRLLLAMIDRCDLPQYSGNKRHCCALLLYALFILLKRKITFTEDELLKLIRFLPTKVDAHTFSYPYEGIVHAAEEYTSKNELSNKVRDSLKKIAQYFRHYDNHNRFRKLAERVEKILGVAPRINIFPGEAWSDAALLYLQSLSPEQLDKWAKLIEHCSTLSGSKPTTKWTKVTHEIMSQMGKEDFNDKILEWFLLVDKPRTQEITQWNRYLPNPNWLIIGPHTDILKGLVWCCSTNEDRKTATAMTSLALSAYKKVPGLGPRAAKIGNACISVLGVLPGLTGVEQLALLKIRVKLRTPQKLIESSLRQSAELLGIPAQDIEELCVPTYGLQDVGFMLETLGDYKAELTVSGSSDVHIRWLKSDGTPQKSVPKSVKDHYSEEMKEVKQAAKDIQKMLSAQRDRIDALILKQKQWKYSDWQSRYLNYPLVGVLARRLIWSFTNDRTKRAGIWHQDKLVDTQNQEIIGLNDNTTVELWHPIGREIGDVLRWRLWLENNRIVQPFKQAHREVYLLTEAERQTHAYSNRFAAHIIKQHQFNALASIRGWNYKLQGGWDTPDETATLTLPEWDLWAEFWVDRIENNDNAQDYNDSGVYYYVATDQVRFYRSSVGLDNPNSWNRVGRGGSPVPLEQIPPIVLSEVFRDVDLFVGVCSVGNDPLWNDGGPEGRYREYWQSYSFGELNATAETRREILERLLPKLKIAPQCELLDRFLVVKGQIRIYKIHLGSGNILMEPNDQYLCIVQSRGISANENNPGAFLPFEGDHTFSLILSKAFLLADDSKIKDPTIVRQIHLPR